MQNVLDKYRKRALTIDMFCDVYSVGRTLAYAEIAAKRLKSVTIGRKRLIPSEEAEEWFNNLSAQPNASTSREAARAS